MNLSDSNQMMIFFGLLIKQSLRDNILTQKQIRVKHVKALIE